MTKKGKVLIFIICILCILLKEEIYGILFKIKDYQEISSYVCNIKNENIENKYQELVGIYDYQDNLEYHLEPTKILFRNIYNLQEGITIYKGTENNIKEKNLVINEQGLVGIVKKVRKNSSEVDLLLNEDLNLSVKIKESYGILKYQNHTLIVEGINNKSNVNIGDVVTTSDISIYPENVFIGTISEIEYDTYEIEKKIKITSGVDFENLKYMSIITDLRGEE